MASIDALSCILPAYAPESFRRFNLSAPKQVQRALYFIDRRFTHIVIKSSQQGVDLNVLGERSMREVAENKEWLKNAMDVARANQDCPYKFGPVTVAMYHVDGNFHAPNFHPSNPAMYLFPKQMCRIPPMNGETGPRWWDEPPFPPCDEVHVVAALAALKYSKNSHHSPALVPVATAPPANVSQGVSDVDARAPSAPLPPSVPRDETPAEPLAPSTLDDHLSASVQVEADNHEASETSPMEETAPNAPVAVHQEDSIMKDVSEDEDIQRRTRSRTKARQDDDVNDDDASNVAAESDPPTPKPKGRGRKKKPRTEPPLASPDDKSSEPVTKRRRRGPGAGGITAAANPSGSSKAPASSKDAGSAKPASKAPSAATATVVVPAGSGASATGKAAVVAAADPPQALDGSDDQKQPSMKASLQSLLELWNNTMQTMEEATTKRHGEVNAKLDVHNSALKDMARAVRGLQTDFRVIMERMNLPISEDSRTLIVPEVIYVMRHSLGVKSDYRTIGWIYVWAPSMQDRPPIFPG
ncbi:hypothetical protein CONPUDRAFT_69599 [Coniophora puteana RWD-64-598 SS2]|uniref:Uncharacterized protein n=1 Tax=Coniophora puteana (strain RWD-64-598) TaxID=741705 RepID=A0A5M3N7F9_CONPW|nr:uncharacterized protein CONPUDRAFT_69599 [Coniophora puteana RWD-64-598 SS2]EIW87373.1 hypothetical protein CONPUDRAFT_69599 [Coniophora puteana RWD-64-598 SS2]